MADTYTTNLNLTKPEPGAAEDTWGISLNSDLDTLDAIFSSSGTQVNLNPNQINFADNKKAIFGTGSDFLLFHDGSNSFIKDEGTGYLNITTNGTDIRLQKNTGEYMAKFIPDGAVELYHNNNERLKTVSDGLLLTTSGGNLSTSATSTNGLVKIKNTDATTGMNNYKSGIAFTTGNTNNTRSVIAAKQTDTSANRQGLAFLVHPDTSAGTMREALQIAHNSDIAFYDDTGTSKNMVWDASADSLNFVDSAAAHFGTGNDLRIYHDGTNGSINNFTGDVLIRQNTNDRDVLIQSDNGSGGLSTYFRADGSTGEAKLYNYGALKLSTKSDGIDVSGVTGTTFGVNIIDPSATAYGGHFSFDDANTKILIGGVTNGTKNTAISIPRDSTQVDFQSHITLPDDAIIKLGNSSDLQIYHDGSNSYIKEAGIGNLQIQATGSTFIKSSDGTKISAQFAPDSYTRLYHNNTKKLETTSTGIDVTGTVTSDGLTVNSGTTDLVATFQSSDQFADIKLQDSGGSSFIRQSNGSLIFEADRDNAVSSSALVFQIDGSNVARFTSDGRLGINTTAPAARLDVRAANGNEASLNIGRSDTGSYFKVNHAGNDLRIYNTDGTGQDILFGVDAAGTDQLNKVGIGTASPSSPLTVESAFDYVANFRSTDTTAGILLTDSNATSRVTNTNGNLILSSDINNEVANTAIRFMLDTTSNSGNDARVVIREAGLGIGVGSPSNPLHVYHATTNQLLRLESGDSTSAALLKDNNGEVLYQNVGGIAQIVSNNSGSGTDGIRFLHQNTEIARFHSNGYLGIGGSSPTVPLDIRQPTNVLLKLSSTTASNNARISFAPNNDEKWNVGVNVSDAAFTYYDVETATTPIKIEQGAPTNTFVLKSTGNIGIGTNSPDRLLDIQGSVPAVRLTDTTTTGMYHEILGDGNSLSIEADDGNVGSGSRIQFKVDGTERARINSSGRLGLNTTNPTTDLEVNATGANGIKITSDQPYLFFNDTDNSGTTYDATISYSGDSMYIGGAGAASIIRFRNKASFGESARITTSGDLLVGTTGTGTTGTNEGFFAKSDGLVYTGRASDVPLVANRITNDGPLISLRKDGTHKGQIGSVDSANGVQIYTASGNSSSTGAGLRFVNVTTSNYIAPCRGDGSYSDNLIDLGISSARFDDIYATNGTIQTSDRNEKQDIQELSDAEQRVATACKGLIRRYKFNSAVEQKGDDARYHFGIIAQDLQDAFTEEGLDAGDYGMFISDTYTDDNGIEQTRLGVRYNELLAFIIATL